MSEFENTERWENAVAVVGVSLRLPGAATLDEFWKILRDGVETIDDFSDAELRTHGISEDALQAKGYVKRGTRLDDVAGFDAAFFNYSAREAEVMDPQNRIFLECAWEALESAGCDPMRFPGPIGLYAAVSRSSYLLKNLLTSEQAEKLDVFSTLLANDKDALATIAAYKLNLRGPCYSVQAFCSSSLVALHLARQSLLDHECDLALAGGVSVRIPQVSGYFYRPEGILAADGHCRAFDAEASGTVFGSGAGVVALKRFADAVEDGNEIHAVVLGSAVNNDGAAKPGYTAPGTAGQRDVVLAALADAGIGPEEIGYVEAHGTGTALGDPVEIAALTEAYRRHTPRKGFCALGSVKSNVGHLDVAAGIVSCLKTIAMLRQREIPATVGYRRPNPRIDFDATPFFVNGELQPWPAAKGQRRCAGVSSFGLGGTNVHAVLEESPVPAKGGPSRPVQLLCLSAKTQPALVKMANNLVRFLREHPEVSLEDVAFTLQVGRQRFDYRWSATCATRDEAIAVLGEIQAADSLKEEKNGRLVALLCGENDADSLRLARDCYYRDPVFRQAFDQCAESCRTACGGGLRAALASDDAASTDPAVLRALGFAVQFALAAQWRAWGVAPAAVLGSGRGEFIAGCLAGVLPLADAIASVVRGTGATPSVAGGMKLETLLARPELALLGLDIASGLAQEAASHPARQSTTPVYVSAVTDGDAMQPQRLLMDQLGWLWRHGVDVNWRGFYASERRCRVSLPTYPFEHQRYWIDGRPAAPVALAEKSETKTARAPLDEWFSIPSWKRGARPSPTGREACGPWLVFVMSDGFAHDVAQRLIATGEKVIRVFPGDGDWEEGTDYWIKPDDVRAYDRLRSKLETKGLAPNRIVHGWSIAQQAARDGDAAVQTMGFYSALHVAQAFGSHGPQAAINYFVITDRCWSVLGDDPVEADRSLIAGLLAVVPQEFSRLRCTQIDVSLGEPMSDARSSALQLLVDELRSKTDARRIAHRCSSRWVEDVERLKVPEATRNEKSAGAVWITGGFGGIGLELARHFARTGRTRLVLSGRSELPARNTWEAWIAQHDDGDPTARRLKALRELEEAGAEVLPLSVDVADGPRMRQSLDEIKARFGHVDLVIHAAGILGAAGTLLVAEMERTRCEKIFRPKVDGVRVLADTLSAEAGVHVVLLSSLSTLVGGIGNAAYAAANAYLDAYAVQLDAAGRNRWLSVSSDTWDFDTLASTGDPTSTIRPAEGAAAIERIIGVAETQVILSPAPVTVRLQSAYQPRVENLARDDVTPVRHPRPAISSEYTAPRDAVETTIAALWQELLGVEPVGVQDSFIELGGHSLLAVDFLARLEEAFGVRVPMHVLFENPTIEKIAAELGVRQTLAAPVVSDNREREQIEL